MENKKYIALMNAIEQISFKDSKNMGDSLFRIILAYNDIRQKELEEMKKQFKDRTNEQHKTTDIQRVV